MKPEFWIKLQTLNSNQCIIIDQNALLFNRKSKIFNEIAPLWVLLLFGSLYFSNKPLITFRLLPENILL